ncbi:ME53 [Agrotis ipsilon multiple nucleopolyhedrovirus]|uniref:ME53 n=1 Tax=Agrotis ipsilon multiple nucleopolyhedrovirus TaxID=208013 RepID=B6D5S4_9ABAC|nr:ME53 [Agrotis ipsilon multiple nucleopolyhedrovirus]ACI28712.1 ME53 [Agrotis ipsilon multiple nucleopolyhedrovirus]
MKKSVSIKVPAKVNTNIGDEKPKDLRNRFLSTQNYRLLSAVSRFATDYVQGVLRVNDLVEMKCNELKGQDLVDSAVCQGECRKKFSKGAKYLFCVVDSAADVNDVTQRWNKFKLVCNTCSNDYAFNAQYEVMQLYPTVSLADVERMCEVGFLTKYIFPIKLEYTESRTETEVPGYHNFYKIVKSIVKDKKHNEQISKIQLCTYGRDLFTETDYDCAMKSGVDAYGDMTFELEFYPRDSNMMAFLETYKDTKPLTYFYRVTKRIYSSRFDYVVYFPIKCTRYCKFCKASKIYAKNNPVLYCSQCGFTDAMFFKNSPLLSSVTFYDECVKSKTLKPKRIFYYDMALYKTMSKKLK